MTERGGFINNIKEHKKKTVAGLVAATAIATGIAVVPRAVSVLAQDMQYQVRLNANSIAWYRENPDGSGDLTKYTWRNNGINNLYLKFYPCVTKDSQGRMLPEAADVQTNDVFLEVGGEVAIDHEQALAHCGSWKQYLPS